MLHANALPGSNLLYLIPYGYRVPINGSWAGFTVNPIWTNSDIKGGAVWQSTWWPAAGFRNYPSAALSIVAAGAYYWSSSFSSSPTNYLSYSLYFDYTGNLAPSYGNYPRSYGFSPLRGKRLLRH